MGKEVCIVMMSMRNLIDDPLFAALERRWVDVGYTETGERLYANL